MPQNQKGRFLDDLYELFKVTPWWVPVAVMGVIFVILVPNHLLGVQYGLFFGALIGVMALLAQLEKYKTRKLLQGQTSLGTLRAMHWRQLEELVAEAYRRQGYQVQLKGGAQADGGIDVVLRKAGQVTLVQCKQWKSRQVGVSVVRELYGVMASEKAAYGIVVTCGSYTTDARKFAGGKNLTLIGGIALLELVRSVQASKALNANAPPKLSSPMPQQESEPVKCPICSSLMILRTARNGSNAGTQFYGCSRYPVCKGNKSMPIQSHRHDTH